MLNQMKTDLRAVFDKYRSLSRIAHELTPVAQLQPVSGVIIARPFDGWGQVLKNR